MAKGLDTSDNIYTYEENRRIRNFRKTRWLYFLSGIFAMMFIGHLHEEFYEELDYRTATYVVGALKLMASVTLFRVAARQ